MSFGCERSCSSYLRVSNFNSKVPQGGIYPHIKFERDPLNTFRLRVLTSSGSTGGGGGAAKTIISPNTSFGDIIIIIKIIIIIIITRLIGRQQPQMYPPVSPKSAYMGQLKKNYIMLQGPMKILK